MLYIENQIRFELHFILLVSLQSGGGIRNMHRERVNRDDEKSSKKKSVKLKN